MIRIDEVKKRKELHDLAVLPETTVRLEAAYYELMDDILEKMPSCNVSNYFCAPNMETTMYHTTSDGVYAPAVYTGFSMEADFDDLMNFADNVDMKKIYATFEKHYIRRGICVSAKITVSADLDPDYLETMRSLGKIQKSAGGVYESSESVFCPTGSDDTPF